MSEGIPSGKSIIGSNSIPDRKRKKAVSPVDLSVGYKGSCVNSDHQGSSYSARVTGDDGVSVLIYFLCAGYARCITSEIYQWVSFHMEVAQKLHSKA